MKSARYRKYNDRSQNSSTYHKKDGTNIRAKLKKETSEEINKSLDINKKDIQNEQEIKTKIFRQKVKKVLE